MSKTVNQKIKLLRLLEILREDSDEDNPLSTAEIITKLDEQGIECGRKSLYDDIKLLNEYGYEVMTIKGRQNLYYVADRTFDIPELRILLDAVQSAAFITKKKTKELSYKICALAGSNRAELLKQNTVHFDTVKHSNEEIFYSVDAIDRAIAQNKQVSFYYYRMQLDGNKLYSHDMERFVVNPVGLIFSSGFYYLVCYSDKHKTLANYRVDRMDKVEIESSDITPAECTKIFASYKEQNLAFGMYNGQEVVVEMLCENGIIDIIWDKFGKLDTIKRQGESHFSIKVNVQISPVFLGWCAMLGARLKILAPQSVIDAFTAHMEGALKQYQ